MSRRYDDPVEVRRRDDVPAEFLWRQRRYVVHGVLDTWVETSPWWCAPAARAVYGVGDPAPTTAAPTAAPTGAPTGLALDEGEREVWRVEAAVGRLTTTGVYDLSFDWSTGAWLLRQTLD